MQQKDVVFPHGRGKRICSNEEFIDVWQAAETPEEVYKTLGFKTVHSAHTRAAYLRANGVPLKYFGRQRSNNWGQLTDRARALLKPTDTTIG